MKRHFPGLHVEPAQANEFLEGIFLVRVDRAYYRWHPQKPFFILSFTVLEPKEFASRKIAGRLYCTQKSLWKLNWFLRDFGYDPDLLGRDEVDEKALLESHGHPADHPQVIRRSYVPQPRSICTVERMGIHLQGCSRRCRGRRLQ